MSLITYNMVFKGYKATEFSFKLLNNQPGVQKFKINHNLAFNIKKNDSGFDLTISVKIEDKPDNPVPFELSVSVLGHFGVNNVNSVNINRLVPKAAEILFPYLRSTASSLTLGANIPPYVLPTINIGEIFLKANIEQLKGKENVNNGMEITNVFFDEDK